MDFSRAEFEGGAAAPAMQCQGCGAPLQQQYWTAGTATMCANCAAQLQAGPPKSGGFIRFLKAFFLGTGAGLLGAIGYGAIIFFTGYELALITIGIGWFVGRAVLKGSEGRGGRGYQVMAALLTYIWCMESYLPMILKGAGAESQDAPSLAVMYVLSPFIALAVPFMGEMGFLSILILAFGVWRGWREPAARVVKVEGPFDLSTTPPPVAAEVPAP